MAKKDKKTAEQGKVKMPFQAPKGMHDILPNEQPYWEKLRRDVRVIAESYNFRRIDTTLLEPLGLFTQSLGAASDIVEKQMFSFRTKGGDTLVLRPEGTASVMRAYIAHGLSHMGTPLKLYYVGPMFRYEQPQAGRLRQFYQAGFEIFAGDDDAVYDAQIILACYRLLEAAKIKQLVVRLNTIGCRNCRPNYRKRLVDYYTGRGGNTNKEKELCGDCRRRLVVNPLRLLDCKNASCIAIKKDAPIILDHLCTFCKSHFKRVLEYIEELNIPYALDNYLVRGLDYYNRTVFEIFTESTAPVAHATPDIRHRTPPAERPTERAFDFALGGGGRYDYLAEMLGGRETAAVGGAIGLDRAIEVMQAFGVALPHPPTKIFLIHMGDLSKKKSLGLIELLRREGISVAESLGKESLKAQLRSADKGGAPLALIFGQKEALEDSIIIRDLRTGAQETVPLHKAASEVKRRLK
ncbi:MAG: histidine--tRNA ligase [Candidatus Harrisonbacteria bacterium]|nr:histidine--tRNA ligase [Candidatus Harrisonbacteria bacterium]MBI3114771.1 histidine--tRNA ligase [Candidatus Harrisonbacteria bacterium]